MREIDVLGKKDTMHNNESNENNHKSSGVHHCTLTPQSRGTLQALSIQASSAGVHLQYASSARVCSTLRFRHHNKGPKPEAKVKALAVFLMRDWVIPPFPSLMSLR